ncbi:hypothetical protein Rhopal_005240-T1 [Rhodotorula paludigena]|uniref:BRCT domain-containing protein n=1 Tax=Rhodotorula paludigena TaxID=86838 RepID=A0AAV5GHW2_9BASI|nr:hypothetical protein Rhopal_005240-T1 [Rhodotorula paludigena]
MASSDSETPARAAKPFKGIVFYVHGPHAGHTRGMIARKLKDAGGTIADSIGDVNLTHMICSPQLWSRQGTANADITIRQTLKANESNRTEDDEDYNRVWLLDLDWVDESLAKGKRLKERDFDMERQADNKRAQREAEIRKETALNKGKSKFGRGERRAYEREQELKREKALQAKLEREGALGGTADAFSGLPAATASAVSDLSSPAAPEHAPALESKQALLSFDRLLENGSGTDTGSPSTVHESESRDTPEPNVSSPSHGVLKEAITTSPALKGLSRPTAKTSDSGGRPDEKQYGALGASNRCAAALADKLTADRVITVSKAVQGKIPSTSTSTGKSSGSSAMRMFTYDSNASTKGASSRPPKMPSSSKSQSTSTKQLSGKAQVDVLKALKSPRIGSASSTSAVTGKASMYGGTKRPPPKVPTFVAGKKKDKGKGKAKAVKDLGVLELGSGESSDDDIPLAHRFNEKMSTGGTGKGKKRAKDESDDDSPLTDLETTDEDLAPPPRKFKRKMVLPPSSEQDKLDED